MSYYSPHLIFYIKKYKDSTGQQKVLGSIDDLYRFYSHTLKDINKENQSALQLETISIIKGETTDYEKTKKIFDYVQSKINYVAFEDGMGGFIPVSYTHLDVYKRQFFNNSRINFLLFCSFVFGFTNSCC